jgi:arsenate reductase (glutaredoxin)
MVELSPMKKSLSHPTPTVYGIPNCDSVKKARVWMDEHAPSYVFHDFKKQGVPEEALDFWLSKVSWEVLVNRKGTTWRKLTPEHQAKVSDAKSARALMLDNPSVIKRPVVVVGESVTVGVNPEAWHSVIN